MPGWMKAAVSPAGLAAMSAPEEQFLFFTAVLQKLTVIFAWAAVFVGKPVPLAAFLQW